jgi:hypothetical protein
MFYTNIRWNNLSRENFMKIAQNLDKKQLKQLSGKTENRKPGLAH